MSGAGGDQPFHVVEGPPGTRFREIRWFAETDSTNRYLVDAARAGAAEGLVVAADHQTSGRGRLGRRWEAPAGRNLLVSILLRPEVPADQLHLCSAVVALAAIDACSATAGLEPAVKWPNDLVVGERKLAGVLAEVDASTPRAAGPSPSPTGPSPSPTGPSPSPTGPSTRAVVVGIGVNAGWPAPAGEPGEPGVPAELEDIATSLWRETGRRVAPADLLQHLLQGLEPRVADLGSAEGRLRQAGAYRRRCSTLGRRVRVDLDGETVVGDAADVTHEGHLLVDVGACLRTISAGDVVHLRADD
jgi:BirA family transcriptional regulator, biotin operon repressor / biotin---[acetyl-CoA-carboxylase] ligase